MSKLGKRCAAAQLVLAFVLGMTTIAQAAEHLLYVATTGDDSQNGGPETPLASLHGVQRRLRELKAAQPESPIRVVITAGDYYLAKPVAFTQEDSGTSTAPITICAAPQARVCISGGRPLSGFQPLQGHAHILVADLKSQGIDDYGDFLARGHEHELHPAGLELFYHGAPAQLSRWPNKGWAEVKTTQTAGDRTQFTYEGKTKTAPQWKHLRDAWAHGFWESDWSDAWQPLQAGHAGAKSLTIERTPEITEVRRGARFRVYNLLEELEQPGEWCLDRTAGLIYFWPPAKLKEGDLVVSMLEHPLSFYDVSHFTLQGLTIEAARVCAVEVVRGKQVTIENCTLRNTGCQAVNIFGGEAHRLVGCQIHHTGEGGVRVEGGDRATLTPSQHVIENNDIHNFARNCLAWRPAVSAYGVGVRIANNLIHDGPDGAIQLNGNDHVVERNEIHSVCLETADVGAIYLGHDWTERGNIIRYNYLHHLGSFNRRDVMAVYLDDFASGTLVTGNVFYDAGRGVVIGGGRDNVIANNIFIDGVAGVQVDSRGQTWAKDYIATEVAPLQQRLAALPVHDPLFRERYPQLTQLLDDEPALAKGNRIDHNIFCCAITIDLHDRLTQREVAISDNWSGSDPHFVDRQRGDFRLREDSPALKLGFAPIPWSTIGLRSDAAANSVVSAQR
ncbi:MAG TPA: right-handed parallel beta-helix repeat-containing protein [Pirellulaceae bacterium]|nr:right-handed parallel beta-helix repeat-containing protein [Pirellulaceae bacterium]